MKAARPEEGTLTESMATSGVARAAIASNLRALKRMLNDAAMFLILARKDGGVGGWVGREHPELVDLDLTCYLRFDTVRGIHADETREKGVVVIDVELSVWGLDLIARSGVSIIFSALGTLEIVQYRSEISVVHMDKIGDLKAWEGRVKGLKAGDEVRGAESFDVVGGPPDGRVR
jgi:hypothetical protein